MRLTLATSLTALLSLSIPAGAADLGAIPLAAHRATYALTLANAKSGGVQAATGSMTYAFIDDCEGWSTQQRLDIVVLRRIMLVMKGGKVYKDELAAAKAAR